uniref:LemA family protein n=1 Tax=Vibrio vulnificus TaxID=672 RepID=UPI0019D4E2B9
VARDDYNQAVRDYNTLRNQFPAVITASPFGFKEEPYFVADAGSRQAPDIGDPNALRRNQIPANK